MFQQIELDQDSPYHKLFLHYSIGVGKIYNPEEIEKERQQFYFKREYKLNYSVAIGNIFTEIEVKACEELAKHMLNSIKNSMGPVLKITSTRLHKKAWE